MKADRLRRLNHRKRQRRLGGLKYGDDKITGSNSTFEAHAGTGWGIANATASQSSRDPYQGSQARRMTSDGVGILSNTFDPGNLQQNQTYLLEAYIFIPGAWTGGDIIMAAQNFNGLVYGDYRDGKEIYAGSWQYAYVYFTLSTDVSGQALIKSAVTPNNTEWFEMDRVRLRKVL